MPKVQEYRKPLNSAAPNNLKHEQNNVIPFPAEEGEFPRDISRWVSLGDEVLAKSNKSRKKA
jgi:hypothetical protein